MVQIKCRRLKLSLLMKDDGTATMSISAPNMPTLKGTGKETGNESPWELSAVDEGGNQMSGGFTFLIHLFSRYESLHPIGSSRHRRLVVP